ncbi:unnamed protein product [Diplocarpon coronariae]|uniref:Septum formation protein Maf n=1 Tax=Diplocarpon coronariae TaxID=2795749 RepID=A0A218YZP7_9HELO|nr:Septum formation protein Maf [Marssonina coronariae]
MPNLAYALCIAAPKTTSKSESEIATPQQATIAPTPKLSIPAGLLLDLDSELFLLLAQRADTGSSPADLMRVIKLLSSQFNHLIQQPVPNELFLKLLYELR